MFLTFMQLRAISMYDRVQDYLMSDTWYSPSRHCQLLCPYHAECTRNPWLSFHGTTVTQFLEWLTPSSLLTLAPYSLTLSVFLNEHGGIIDDTVIMKHMLDAFYVVTNAGWCVEDLA
jgi:Aminomethyltransferase folate-binding domain